MLREADTVKADVDSQENPSQYGLSLRSGGHLELEGGFSERLENSLGKADRERHRNQIARRVAAVLPVLLLATPVFAWHLVLASPGGPHAVITSLAWLTFILDVGVHTNQSVLSYLGLQMLPSVVGILLLLLVTGWLLSHSQGDE